MIFALLIIGLGLFILFSLYNKPLIDIDKSKASITVEAQQIIDDFKNDELLANKKYVDKIIQITGEISKINIENNKMVISLKDDKNESSVMCHIETQENLANLKLDKGKIVTIKGVCTGYLMDVIMVRCILQLN